MWWTGDFAESSKQSTLSLHRKVAKKGILGRKVWDLLSFAYVKFVNNVQLNLADASSDPKKKWKKMKGNKGERINICILFYANNVSNYITQKLRKTKQTFSSTNHLYLNVYSFSEIPFKIFSCHNSLFFSCREIISTLQTKLKIQFLVHK